MNDIMILLLISHKYTYIGIKIKMKIDGINKQMTLKKVIFNHHHSLYFIRTKFCLYVQFI